MKRKTFATVIIILFALFDLWIFVSFLGVNLIAPDARSAWNFFELIV